MTVDPVSLVVGFALGFATAAVVAVFHVSQVVRAANELFDRCSAGRADPQLLIARYANHVGLPGRIRFGLAEDGRCWIYSTSDDSHNRAFADFGSMREFVERQMSQEG